MTPLHTPRRRLAPTLLLSLVAAIAGIVAAPSALAASDDDLGVELISGSRKIAEHRFESTRDYEATLKFYKDRYRSWKDVRIFREVSLPGAKYVHFENENEKASWAGLNVYQLADGRVRYFVIPRGNDPATSKGGASSQKGKGGKPATTPKRP